MALSAGREAVMGCRSVNLHVEPDGVAATIDHNRRQVAVPQSPRHPVPDLEGLGLAAQQVARMNIWPEPWRISA